MKHLLFTISFLFCLNSFSQDKNWTTHNGKSLSELPAYVQVVRIFNTKPSIATVYYGGEPYKRPKDIPIKLSGQEYRFNDIIEVVNLFHSFGYKVVSEKNSEGYEEVMMYKSPE